MESADFHRDLALLQWQIELGATEAILDAPVNRYELPATLAKPAKAAAQAAPDQPLPVKASGGQDEAVAEAERLAQAAQTLDDLRGAVQAYEHCELRKGARNLVFGDGTPGARVMVVTDAPDREEDRAGKPLVGQAGRLLDRMFAAIELGRERAEAPIYIASVLPWRTPQTRDPKPEEIAMMKPFLMRHITLAKPEYLVLMGNLPCTVLLGKRGITRLRGQWTEAAGLPALPMFHPGQLLRSPELKREAWADLLSLKSRLREGPDQ
jgi:DNA polymerase